jgi:hypothetical protein
MKWRVMTGTSKIDDHGVDVRAMRERWEKSKVYSVVPEEVSTSLNMLVRAGQRAKSPAESQEILEKMVEVFKWARPSGIEFDAVPCKQFTIMVPKNKPAPATLPQL